MRRILGWLCFGMMIAALGWNPRKVYAYEPVLGPRRPFHKIDLSTLKFPDRHPLLFYTPAEIEKVQGLLRTGDESLPQVRVYRGILANAEQWVNEDVEIDPKGSKYLGMEGGLCPKDTTELEHWRLRDRSWKHRCPKCGTGYEGEAYDSWARGMENMHLAWRVQAFGMAYALGGEARYARRAREILLGFARTYTHMATPCTEEYLNLFYWNEYLSTGYDVIYESNALSNQDRRLIENGLFRPMADTILRIAGSEGRNNRGAHAIANAGMIGFLLRDRDIVDYCLNSPEDVNAAPVGTFPCSFAFLMANCVDEDGLWIERIGYHWYTMQGLVNLTEPAYRAGINLYALPRFHAMFTGPVELVFPDGGINERSGTLPILQYELAQSRAPAPLFEKVLAGTDAHSVAVTDRTLWITPTWPTTGRSVFNLGSRNFTGWGYAILRSGQAPEQTFLSTAWLDHAIYGGHAEEMKFGVIYHAGGRLWTPFGNAPYINPLCAAWSRRPASHNALAVDQQAQKISFGRTAAFHAGPRLQVFEAEENQAYPGVTQRRLTMLADGYAIDVCRAVSDTEHQYDLAERYYGEMTPNLNLQARPGPLGWRAGYEYMNDVRSSRSASTWSADWRQDAGHALRLTMLGGPATEVVASKVPERSTSDLLSMMLVRRHGKRATFVSLLEAYGTQPTIASAEVLSPAGEEGTVAKVTRATATDYLLVNSGRHEGFQLDGVFGLVSMTSGNAEARYAQLVNGRRLDGGGWSVTSDLPATIYVERVENGDYLVSADSLTNGAISLEGKLTSEPQVRVADGGGSTTATAASGSLRFEVEAGSTYRVSGLSGLTRAALQARARPAGLPPTPVAESTPQTAAVIAPITGKNRVRNSGFERNGPDDAGPWRFGSTYYDQNFQGGHAYDHALAHSGKSSLRLPSAIWFSPVTKESWVLQENVVATPGTSQWTLSAYVRADKPTKVRLCLFGNEPRWGETDEGGVSQVYDIDAQWQRISITRAFGPTVSSIGIVVKREHQAFGGDVWVDDIQLEQGQRATPYVADSWAPSGK